MTHEIGHENEAALEHTHEYRVLARKVAAYLRAGLGHARLDLILTDQNSFNILVH